MVFVDYSGKGTKSYDVLTTGDQELEVRAATYGPEIDQSVTAREIIHPYNKKVYSILTLKG